MLVYQCMYILVVYGLSFLMEFVCMYVCVVCIYVCSVRSKSPNKKNHFIVTYIGNFAAVFPLNEQLKFLDEMEQKNTYIHTFIRTVNTYI